MATPANVRSIEAIEQFRASVADVDHYLRNVLTQFDLELRRAIEWIDIEMATYWPKQVRLASDRLSEALNELERCQLRVGSDERPACYEQKKAVERAKRRWRLCEEKVRLVRTWRIKLRQELTEVEAKLGRVTNFLDADTPRALAELDRMILALHQYAQLAGGEG